MQESLRDILAAVILVAILGALCLLLSACGVKHGPTNDPATSVDLDAKVALYSEQLKTVQDQWGAVDTYECNSLQRSGLICAAGAGKPVNLRSFEDGEKPGRFYRRPTAYPECHSAGESRSTISPDDLLGAFWCAWRTQDLAVAQSLWAYGKRRDWFMGDDRIGGLHTRLRAGEVATLAQLVKTLGGSDYPDRHGPAVWGNCEGFVCALQAYEILLRLELYGSVSAHARERIRHGAERQKTNPLLQFAWHLLSDGDQSETRRLLLELPRYPSDHLPTSDEICGPWSLERDDDSDSLRPCPGAGKIHSGGDLLFVAHLLDKYRDFRSFWISPNNQWGIAAWNS
jgi:hypothetical protein